MHARRTAEEKCRDRARATLRRKVDRVLKQRDDASQVRVRKLDENSLPFRLGSLSQAALPQLAIERGLQKKGADLGYVAEICAAANQEAKNGMSELTQKLSRRSTERTFHKFWSRDLPRVSKLALPVVLSRQKKKVAFKKCSGSFAVRSICVQEFCTSWPILFCHFRHSLNCYRGIHRKFSYTGFRPFGIFF